MNYIQFTNPVSIQYTKTVPVLPRGFPMKRLFSDNSLVVYKTHSLAPGGIGTVKNSRRKGSRT